MAWVVEMTSLKQHHRPCYSRGVASQSSLEGQIQLKTNPTKRVWILGAGFSRSLGGPLMNYLLSLDAKRRIATSYSDEFVQGELERVFWLYHAGTNFAEGTLAHDVKFAGVKLWHDAEKFLEMLDAAARGESVERTLIQDLLKLLTQQSLLTERCSFSSDPAELDSLFASAKRVVAASCRTFLKGLDEAKARAKERWRPYQQWLGALGSNDSLVTFNYDLVLETLEPMIPTPFGGFYGWGVHVVELEDSRENARKEGEMSERQLPFFTNCMEASTGV